MRKPQSQLAETAIEQYLERSEWQLKEIEQGLKEIDEGRVISHEDLLQHWEGKSASQVD
jgi:predicted transcriptional regulator